MRTASITLGALGIAALFLGYVEVLGSASGVVHVVLLVLAVAGLAAWSLALSLPSSLQAGACLLLLSLGSVGGLAALALSLRPEALPYAVVAAPFLLLASGSALRSQEAG